MKYARYCTSSLIAVVAAATLFAPPQATAKNGVKEYLKYFNPMPQKNYVNASQDRRIKKEKFRLSGATAAVARNPEQGLFAILPADKLADTDYADKLLANNKVSGLSVLIPWKTLEPEEEKYHWSYIDNLLALCQKHDKAMILRVSTCGVDLAVDPRGDTSKPSSDTPSWVLDNGVKSVKYLDKDNKAHLMPVFWDQTYLAAFSNFINEMGSRYDKNKLIHSIGITGGGFRGTTSVVPTTIEQKGGDKTATNESGFTTADQIDDYLRKNQNMTQKQVIDHWKYVADLFPQAFKTTRLNFVINPPTPNRAGEDALDEISDYLLFRYGEHIYITRNLKNGKHSFDDFRVQLKFRSDTYAGVSVLPTFGPEDMTKLSTTALDDGISFVEVPPEILESSDQAIQQALDKLSSHVGYQIVMQKASIPSQVLAGEALKTEFSFYNAGNTSPKRPMRELDKDVAGSYKLLIEIKDEGGKTVARVMHTPDKKTEQWKTGETVSWQKSLKMPSLPAGTYQAAASLYDPDLDRKLNFLDGRTDKQEPLSEIALGKLTIAPATADKTSTN